MRLIDADSLHDEICERMAWFPALGKERAVLIYNFAEAVVADAPTVDAVPVVRCRNCKYYGYDALGHKVCNAAVGLVYPEDDSYCSYGKRNEQSADLGKMETKE